MKKSTPTKFFYEGGTYETEVNDKGEKYLILKEFKPPCMDYVTSLIIPSSVEGLFVRKISTNILFAKGSIEKVFIPYSITEIQHSAFTFCANLKEVIFEGGNPNEIILKEASFAYCKNLQKIIFLKQVLLKEIPSRCFSGCTSLSDIELPDTITSIKESAFLGCESLKNINFSSLLNLRTLEKAAFSRTGLSEIIFNSDELFVDEEAFEGNYNLRKLVFRKDNIHLRNFVFLGCPNLEHIFFSSKAVFSICANHIKAEAFVQKTDIPCENTVNFYFEDIKALGSVPDEVPFIDVFKEKALRIFDFKLNKHYMYRDFSFDCFDQEDGLL